MVCNHPAREPSHDRCRSHALCSIEGRYNRSGCPACDVLWQQARSSNPAEASPALARLKEWTEGFSRNSKQSEYFEKLDIFPVQVLYFVHSLILVLIQMFQVYI